MITIFNRAEVAITYDAQKQRDIRNTLKNCGIKCRVIVKNTSRQYGMVAGSRTRNGAAGMNAGASYEYKIYVSRSDYDEAKDILKSF